MKNSIKVAALLGLSAVTLCASGYKIPEQSLNGTALSAAYIANADGADASYYNPANMAWMEDGAEIETTLTYLNLPKVSYIDGGSSPSKTGVPASDADSLSENFYIPTLHYVSSAMGDWRFGFSMVTPGGLSKRWDEAFPASSANEFSLAVIELNPTASYKVNDKFAVGFGLRGIYSKGVIRANSTLISQDMDGDSIDFGYNLAMSYKPLENLTLSSTYRSKVDLTIEGDARGHISQYVLTGNPADLATMIPYNTPTDVMVPLPATFALAAAYTMNKTTVEVVFERTYWSAYDVLDFNFDDATAEAVLGGVKPKNWKDVNAYRIGITHQYNDDLKLMAAFAIDKNPIPDDTLGFELPDSDAKLYSVGLEYKLNKDTKIGLAYLYDDKETRSVNQGVDAGDLIGTFTDASAHLLTMSVKYRF